MSWNLPNCLAVIKGMTKMERVRKALSRILVLGAVLCVHTSSGLAQGNPSSSNTQPGFVKGYYVALSSWGNFHTPMSFIEQNQRTNRVSKREFRFKPGYGIAAAIGYQVSQPWRFEFELNYRTAALSKILSNHQETDENSLATGNYTSFAGMANVYLDIGRDFVGDFQPYLGFGIGGAKVSTQGWRSPAFSMKDADATVIAYQLMGGIGYRLTPKLKVALDYRWFRPNHIKTSVTGTGLRKKLYNELEYHSHNVGLNMRFNF